MRKSSYRADSGAFISFRYSALLWAVLLFCAGNAAAQQAVPPSPASPADPIRDYVIGPQDLLQISIHESAELSRELRVSAEGFITPPLLDRIVVGGLTLADAERLIAKKYREGGILNDPHVTISVKELQSKPVTVMGAVRNPGVFQISGQTRLLRVVSQAGGLTEDAGAEIQVLRAVSRPGEEVVRVSSEAVRSGSIDANLPIWGGDTVNVAPGGAVYAVGAVNRPGRHTLGGQSYGLTVLQLVALAEDVKRTARVDKAVLIRKNEIGVLEQIPVDLKKILSQKQPDLALRANDVLFVPDSAGKRAMTRGLEAALQIATSVAIFGVI
jgi:polysaccharide export outer membrane protein